LRVLFACKALNMVTVRPTGYAVLRAQRSLLLNGIFKIPKTDKQKRCSLG